MSSAPIAAVPSPSAAPGTRPSGWWGMILLIATESTLFAVLLATYFYLRFKTPGQWPPAGISDPKILQPLLATVVLVLSSVAVFYAARRAQLLRPPAARAGLAVAVALGVAFLTWQDILVEKSLDKFGVSKDAYSSIYYTLVGLHAVHVVAGVLLAVWAILRSFRFDRTALVTVRVTALYWHFVNVIAVLVFLTLYLSPRG